MTKTVDVAAGQKIASPWGNEIRDRTWQQFATMAARDAAWPAASAPAGAHCVTNDTNTEWIQTGGAWVPTTRTLVQGTIAGGTAAASASGNAATVIIPNQYAGRPTMFHWTCALVSTAPIIVTGYLLNPGSGQVFKRAAHLTTGDSLTMDFAMPAAGAGQWTFAVTNGGTATVTYYADGTVHVAYAVSY